MPQTHSIFSSLGLNPTDFHSAVAWGIANGKIRVRIERVPVATLLKRNYAAVFRARGLTSRGNRKRALKYRQLAGLSHRDYHREHMKIWRAKRKGEYPLTTSNGEKFE